MDIQKPMDAELASADDGGLPQITLTFDLDWVSSSLDHEHDPETQFDATEDLPDLKDDSPQTIVENQWFLWHVE